jgi:phospholipid N-methyltransferase
MFSWLSKFLKAPREVGSIMPSSSSLGKRMASGIPRSARVAELGPGNGAITTFIREKIAESSQLTLVEMDAGFAHICRERFPGANVVTGDIEDWLKGDVGAFDFIISGIPFAVMEPLKRRLVFQLIADHLKPQGSFIMFQYSVSSRDELKTVFGDVTTQFVPLNVLPAFVFTARQKQV